MSQANGEFITKEEGKELIDNYQDNNPGAIKAHLFDANLLTDILNQNGCTGIRMYHGEDSGGTPCLVLVGVDASGNDQTDQHVLEKGSLCPNICPQQSYFNS